MFSMKALMVLIPVVIVIAVIVIVAKNATIGGSTDDKALSAVTPVATNKIMDNQTPAATSSAGLKIEDEVVGTGDTAVAGKHITVNYKGTLTDGTQFDSSYGKRPFDFDLGAHQVIEGWDEGVAGMKVGGKRKLTIPPSLGYGSQDNGPIPANSTLLFEVELLKVE